MVTGVHAMFFTPAAKELREFFRDKVGIPNFDAGEGWLIFTPQSGEVGCHEAEANSVDISLYCDDINATVTAMKARGVEFTAEVEDHGYGLVTFFRAPADITIQLYQAKYAKPTSL